MLTVPQTRLVVRDHEIPTRAPLFAAAEQMRPGFEAEVGPRPGRWFFDGPPAMRPVAPNMLDLTGVAWGRVVVVGLLVKKSSNENASWVIRCACGTYETRRARAIRLKSNPDEACTRCDYVQTAEQRARRWAYFEENGAFPSDDRSVRDVRRFDR